MTAVLRHAGSANPDKPGSAYGNQQFAGSGSTRHCVTCDTWSNAGPGWKRAGPLRLWRCPGCVKEKANASR